MNKTNHFIATLWDLDPGYLHLKHAGKTIIAIVIALGLTRNYSLYTMLVAGVGSGISMQGIVAKSFGPRFLQLLIFNFSYLAAFILGLLVRDSAFLTAIALTLLGFTVNYIRRFGLQNSTAPIMIWLLCFFATILPLASPSVMLINIEALLTGMAVSALVFLFLFPENYAHLFALNSKHIYEELASGLWNLKPQTGHKTATFHFDHHRASEQHDFFNHLLASNQTISDQLILTKKNAWMAKALLCQYTLFNAYNIILESYSDLAKKQLKLPPPIQQALNLLHKDYIKLFRSAAQEKDYSLSLQHLMIALEERTGHFGEHMPKDPELIMSLLNLKLGFHLFNKNMAKLLWVKHET